MTTNSTKPHHSAKPLTEIDLLIIKYFKQGIKGRPLSELITNITGTNVNKNVICGRTHRLKEKGYLDRTPPTSTKGVSHRYRKAKRVNGALTLVKPRTTKRKQRPCHEEEIMPVPTVQPPPSKHLILTQLTRYTCRFPSPSAPFTFCGHRVTKGQYCTAHAQICYAGKPIRRPRQLRTRTIG